jgi:hypothetical protein
MNDSNSNNAQAVIDTVKALHSPVQLSALDPQFPARSTQFVAVPKGMDLFSLKEFHDEWLERPRRLVGTATLEALKSFCEHVSEHKTARSRVFASNRGGYSMEAVFDYHGTDPLGGGSTPSFCDHRAKYLFPQTPALLAWNGASQWRGQTTFSQFLDAQRFDLIDPLDIEKPAETSIVHEIMLRSTERTKRGEMAPAKVFASPGDIMQLVETLSGSSKRKWTNVKTDRYGNVKATHEAENKVDGDDEKIPTLFLVAIAAFVGGDKLVLPARIKAQVNASGLQLSAELVGVERILEQAFEAAIAEVHASTGCVVRRGTPES